MWQFLGFHIVCNLMTLKGDISHPDLSPKVHARNSNCLPDISTWVSNRDLKGNLLEAKDMGCVCAQACLTLCDSIESSLQAPLSMGFSRQEYWSRLPFPFPGDLPDPGIQPRLLSWQVDSLPPHHLESPGHEIGTGNHQWY